MSDSSYVNQKDMGATPPRLAVRAPEYWPGPEFMGLALRVDQLVLADTFQYSRQSFHNRAKLRNPNGWQWISVPLQGGQHGVPICEAKINNNEPWQRKHWRALEYNYRSSPYFEYYEHRFKPFLERTWETLGDLTCATVHLVLELLDAPCEIVQTSTLASSPTCLADALAVLGKVRYHTVPAAAEYDREVDPSARIVETSLAPYCQNFDGFEPDMSVLDILFNYGPETRQMLYEASSVVPKATDNLEG